MHFVLKYSIIEQIPLLAGTNNSFGGLYGMSFLSDFKSPFTPYHLDSIPDGNDKISLHLIGDSYLANKVTSGNFINTSSMFFADWRDKPVNFTIDSTKFNILIIESTERYLLTRFLNKETLYHPFSNSSTVYNPYYQSITSKLESIVASREIDNNLNYLFFDFEILTPIKEFKADFNYHYFNRLPANIYVSDDKKYLFLGETIDSSLQTSAFKKISSDELNQLINNINEYTENYMNKGFNKVYLSIIPNPVSILGYRKQEYNNLITKIENSSQRKFETINVFNEFKESNKQLYHYSDTHWNSAGLQMWVDKVNTTISQLKTQDIIN